MLKRTIYPGLAARAKRDGADIYFWDESGFRADALQGRTWGVRGCTPVVEMPGIRQSVSAASAVNRKGAFWFATYKGGMSAELFVSMLKHILKGRRKPLFLALDSLPAHRARMVRDYVETTHGKLELHFLPGYAPELNPDELVWIYVSAPVGQTPARLRRSAASPHRVGPARRPEQSRTLLISAEN